MTQSRWRDPAMEARRHDPARPQGASATEPVGCTLGANDNKSSKTTGGSAPSHDGLHSAATHPERCQRDAHRCVFARMKPRAERGAILRRACTGASKRRRQNTLAPTSFLVEESCPAPCWRRAGSIAPVCSRPASAGKHGWRGTSRCHGTRLSAAGFC